MRHLSLIERILIIKILAFTKIINQATVLSIINMIVKK